MKVLFLTLLFLSIFLETLWADKYVNTVYGVSLKPPTFSEDPNMSIVNVVTFFALPDDHLTANLGVIIQRGFNSLADYVALSESQFTTSGIQFSRTETSVSGIPAMRWEYENFPEAKNLKFIALAVHHRNLIYLLTGVSLKKNFETHKTLFLASMQSFSFMEDLGASKTSPHAVSEIQKEAYQNDTYKFTLVPPKFSRETRENVTATLAQFFATSDNGFTANVNIIYQKTSLSVEDYLNGSEKEFEAMGLKIVSKNRFNVSNFPAVLYETTGTFSSFSMTFLTLLILKEGECILLTCTGSSAQFADYRSLFQTTVESLQLQ